MLRSIIFAGVLFGTALLGFGQDATVNSDNATVRGTPTVVGRVIDTIPRNTKVEIIQQKGNWYLVQTDEVVGWVYGDALRLLGTRAVAPANWPVPLPTPRPRLENHVTTGTTSSSTTTVQPVVIVEKAESAPTVKPPVVAEQTANVPAEERVATGVCRDGTLTYATEKQGACSDHGGVYEWTGEEEKESKPAPSTGGPVQVRGYYRKDGTYVRPHTRRRPN